jgi:hypothetical protein
MSEEVEVIEDAIEMDSAPKRTNFITVLCILSWVYVGWSLIGAIGQMGGTKEAQMEELDKQIETLKASEVYAMDIGKDMVAFYEHTLTIPAYFLTLTVLFLLVEGLGVFMVFQLKRTGFWIYLAAQAGLIGVTIASMPWPNSLSTIALSISMLITLVFVILYGVNLKHLK